MIPKALGSISLSDIESLIVQQVAEGRTLEFKRELVGPRDEDKREFLADVSAFANTVGGDIVFGVEQVDGVASALKPIPLPNVDAEQQRLDAIIRSGLDPRLPQIEFKWLPASAGHFVLVIRIQRSWAAPHRVTFRDHSKFYARNSSGKYPMDVNELRAAFDGSHSLASKIKAFRRERENVIAADEGPIGLTAGAKLVFYILPVSAFTNPLTLSLGSEPLFSPLNSGGGFNYLHTLEGFATYSGREETDVSRSYTLIFRDGAVEAATHIGQHRDKYGFIIYPETIELTLLQHWKMYLENLQRLGVEPPFYITLSLLDVRGYFLVGGNSFFYRDLRQNTFRRDRIILPEIICEEALPNSVTVLRPLFDLLWQAFGYPQSFSFDDNGQYVGRR